MKVKETTQKRRDKGFEDNLSFEEWLDYFNTKPTNEELDDMEKQSHKPIVQNNPNYYPIQGA